MDVVLLHNPNAGEGDCPAEQLEKLLREAGFRPHRHDLAHALTDRARLDDGEFVVAAGGDGTIRKVALALLDHPRPLAPLPLGTANNIARSLGLGDDIQGIIRGWTSPRRRRFDVGIASGPWGKRTFIEGVGLGVLSRAIAALSLIDRASDRDFANTEDKLYRDLCVVAALAQELPARNLVLEMDGTRTSEAFVLVEILNIRRAGPGIELAADATPFDGVLDVATVTASGRRRLVDAVLNRMAGKRAAAAAEPKRTRSLRLHAADCDVRIDDTTERITDPAVIDVTLTPAALELVLPRFHCEKT